ncbi:hypothetical protein B7463_g12287, partial [Scytalidium lignicola]
MASEILAEKVCLITGGAGGLGKAIAREFLQSGAKVVVSDINEIFLKTATDELSPLGSFLALKGDVTSEESAMLLFQEIIKTYGQLDVLVNNAGIMDQFGPVGEVDKTLWDKVIQVNLTGPFIMTKLAVLHFLERKGKGVVLNIGSLASIKGGVSGAAYTASKHGLLGLTKSTAVMYGKNDIRCNILMPGSMATNISTAFASGISQVGEALLRKGMAAVEPPIVPLDQVGKTAAFVCSDGAGFLNGAQISVDGGWNAY